MTAQLNASLLRLKLLDALRSGETAKVDALYNELSATKATTHTTELIQLKETILHYAVQVAPLSVLQHIVEHNDKYNLDINAQDQDGNTPLHLAAAASRLEIVKYLLSLPHINDTVVNLKKKQPVEVCKDLNIAQLMQIERAKFVEKAACDLRRYFSTDDFANLEELLVNNPRSSELLDINGADPETGNTVLHEFIAKNDLRMCDWILKHGGDPFKRDRRGRLPVDLIPGKNEALKKLLKAASKDQTIMDPVINTNNAIRVGAAPTYKGYLRKWTNFASGYKLRYFVLDEQGVLSYYTNQDDTINACRGSLNLGFAVLHLDSSEKLKFEIIGKNGIRWHLKANHPIETNRWVWTLQNAITIAKDNIKKGRTPEADVEDSDISRVNTRASTEEPEKKSRLLHLPRRKHKKSASQYSLGSGVSDTEDVHLDALSRSSTFSKRPNNVRGSYEHREDFDLDMTGEYESDNESEKDSDDSLTEQVSTVKRALDVEVSGLLDLFGAVDRLGTNSPEVYDVGTKTLKSIQDLVTKYDTLVKARDEKRLRKLERQGEVNKLWEQSIKQLEAEIAKREESLAEFEGKKKQLRKYLSSGAITPGSNTPGGQIKTLVGGTLPEDALQPEAAAKQDIASAALVGELRATEQVIQQIFQEDSEEEFFDADEFDDANEPSEEDSHTVVGEEEPEKVAVEPPVSEHLDLVANESQKIKKVTIEQEGSFLGYENPPRSKLAYDEDNRPKVGLWGILKSMIGKDMTKMTLPVSFNECTSLLQRLTEDIEYSSLLDTAAGYDDSTLRMVYVAAFAASEYSSTINRIAKPFNPLLGETFEYCRPDQNYRLITEQVSHHPPISACSAESIKWDYYGENAVDSQFKGRSFDFKHLGKMFCVIRPDNGVIDKNGNRVESETYSWKKVNTSVVGIIMGNPTVDNYGKMEVTNHTTGDVIVVDLKQRGWKAASAYQLYGKVVDAKGKAHWAIGGRWNSKIYGKKIVDSVEDHVRRDSLVEGDAKVSLDPHSGNKFLVWQVTPRPKIPFNLTAFAVTLNGLDEKLRPWLAPTDTRLRPDQRAMEDGRYDDASNEKHRVEEKQRKARRDREAKKQAYKPNWFEKKRHPITGDAYWEFTGEYWTRRKNHELADSGDIF